MSPYRSVLLLAVATVILVPTSVEACWLCRHHGYHAGYGGVSGVSSVSNVAGIQAVQTVQTVPTFSAYAAMPMVVASPLAVHGVTGVQMVGGTHNINNIPSSEVQDVKSDVAGVQQELQSLRSDLLGTLLKEFLIPLAGKVIEDRLGLEPPPSNGGKTCGCESGRTNGHVPPTMNESGMKGKGAWGPQGAAGAAGVESISPAEKSPPCPDCKKCEKCRAAGAKAGDVPKPPEGHQAARGSSDYVGRLASHAGPTRNASTSDAALDAKLDRIERKNAELLRRLKALGGT
jgi:hypothetical protein